jgi:hypothetical protein
MSGAMRGVSTFGFFLLAGCCVMLAACGAATPADPTLPMTVGPATYEAWQPGPVKSKLQAAIAAQVALGATRLHYAQPPQAIFVEQVGSPEGQRRMRSIDAKPAADAWLVIFEGDYQIIGPAMPATPSVATPTPIPYVHGCVFVILSTVDSTFIQAGTTTSCR